MEWKRKQRTGLRRLQESYIPLYERTSHFHVYSSDVVCLTQVAGTQGRSASAKTARICG